MTRYPAICLWQPFASLIFSGHKRHETRSWPLPPSRQGRRHAIAATLGFTPRRLVSAELDELCRQLWGSAYRDTLPRGVILGTVELVDSASTDERDPFTLADRIAGDWSPGRHAWKLDAPIPLPGPVKVQGRQGWFEVEL